MSLLQSSGLSMSGPTLWLVIVLAGLLTYAIRLSFILVIGQRDIPKNIQSILRFIPPAVLSAIIFPELFRHSGMIDISLNNDRLLAGIVAGLVAWKSKNAILTIVVGMGLLWILQLI